MFGIALILYLLFLLAYGAFLWAALWHLRVYRIQENKMERVSTAIVACIGILLLVSLLLFFQIPWHSYSLLPSSLL